MGDVNSPAKLLLC